MAYFDKYGVAFSDDRLALKNCPKDFQGEYIIPEGVKVIEKSAFEDCTGLVKTTLPESVQQIEHEAFRGCVSLNEINFPSYLYRIGSQAFEGAESLTTAVIPAELRYLGDRAFAKCVSLDTVQIFAEGAYIAPSAFRECVSVSKLYLRDYNPYISLTVFADSRDLNYIIPLSSTGEPIYSKATTKSKMQLSLSAELKYMAMYYHNLGMNITQMKWEESQKNDKSFKEPIDSHWSDYKQEEQDFNKLMSFNWDGSQGIGLILGYNNYRALDVDGVNRFLLKAYYGEKGFDNFINKFLGRLGLPLDYPWVVYSGSGNGFHIIFKVDDIGEDIDSISFEHNDKYGTGGAHPAGFYEQDHFERIELRWCDHLILPPSIHASGQRYSFRNGEEPTMRPLSIGVTELDNLINHFCGETKLDECTYTRDDGKEIELKLAETHKIVSRHDSYLSPHDYSQMPLKWLEHSSSDESKISLALRYIKGDGVPIDLGKAQRLLSSCNSQHALFNLLSLYSCSVLPCDADYFENLLKKLDSSLFPKESVNLIKENAKKFIKESKRIVNSKIKTKRNNIIEDHRKKESNKQNESDESAKEEKRPRSTEQIANENRRIIFTITAILLLIGCLPLPIPYYTLLRYAVFLVCSLEIWNEWQDGLNGANISMGLIAIIFNPIIPVYLHDKSVWVVIDAIAALYFAIKAYKLYE